MEIICDRSGVQESPQSSSLSNPAAWLVETLSGGKSDSGASVTWKTTLGVSAVWYCVNRISNDVAQLPLNLYLTQEQGGTEEDKRHPAGRVIRAPMVSPINSFHLRKTLQMHALLWGNGRGYIVRSGRQEPADIVPLPPDRSYTVSIYETELGTRQKVHVVWTETGEPIPVPDRDVLHIFSASNDGYNGLSPLEVLRNAFGLSMSTDKTANVFFKNNAVPGLVLEAPPGVFRKEEDAVDFLRKWNQYHAGLDNTGKAGLLREGIKAHTLTMPFKDAQMLEQREFQVREIMRVFGVPMIPGVSDSQSYNTLEQLNRAYLLHCLGPWLKVWEVECAAKLLTDREKRAEEYYFSFDTWELVKPDANQRAEMLSKLVGSMIITPNEARDWEGLPPVEGGDRLLNPNTTSGAEPSDEPDDDEDEMMDATEREMELAAARIKPLVSAEVRRVREMAAKARNFVDWCESYYAKHGPRMNEVVLELGGDSWIAAEYVEHSKYELLEVAGACRQEELPDRVEQVTAAWMPRVDELAARICEVAR